MKRAALMSSSFHMYLFHLKDQFVMIRIFIYLDGHTRL